MEAPKLETMALLKLFENLQGAASEEFAREILKRSSFFCDVKFIAPLDAEDEDDGLEPAAFVISTGVQSNRFEFMVENLKVADIKALLTGKNATFIIDNMNGGTSINVYDSKVTFNVVRRTGDNCSCTVPYECCKDAFQQFHDWRSGTVVPACLCAVDVKESKFENGVLTIIWDPGFARLVTKKFNVRGLGAVGQWERLLAGENIEICIEATEYNDFQEYVIRCKKEAIDLDETIAMDLIWRFYREDGVINGGDGLRFQLENMKPAILAIIEHLKRA